MIRFLEAEIVYLITIIPSNGFLGFFFELFFIIELFLELVNMLQAYAKLLNKPIRLLKCSDGEEKDCTINRSFSTYKNISYCYVS